MWTEGIFYLGATGFLWSAIGIIFGKAANKESFFPFLFLSTVIFVGTTWIFTFPAAAPACEILKVSGLMFPSALAGQLGFLALREAIKRGSLAISWCLAQAAMLWPFLSGTLFLGEPATPERIGGMAIVCIGLPLLAGTQKSVTPEGRRRNPYFLWFAFGAFALIGLQQTLSLIPNRLIQNPEALSWRVPVSSLAGLGWIFFCRRRSPAAWKDSLVPALGYGVLVACGQWTLFRAIDTLSGCAASGIAYPLAVGISIVLLTFYSGMILREKLSRLAATGIAVIICGIILLALSNIGK